jgi:hypothetical protein
MIDCCCGLLGSYCQRLQSSRLQLGPHCQKLQLRLRPHRHADLGWDRTDSCSNRQRRSDGSNHGTAFGSNRTAPIAPPPALTPPTKGSDHTTERSNHIATSSAMTHRQWVTPITLPTAPIALQTAPISNRAALGSNHTANSSNISRARPQGPLAG